MIQIRSLVALCAAALVTACASPGPATAAAPPPPPADQHAGHDPAAGAAAPMAAMDPRMKTMHEMHQKMASAKTPAERQALMAEHMAAMKGGMAMMEGMSGMGALGGKAPMGGMAAMGEGKAMPPAEMAKHHQMMAQRMDAMQMMMEMMMDRMPPAPAMK